eukprot:scaffold14065_cov25-Tisochrysis_lutea.AAC.2
MQPDRCDGGLHRACSGALGPSVQGAADMREGSCERGQCDKRAILCVQQQACFRCTSQTCWRAPSRVQLCAFDEQARSCWLALGAPLRCDGGLRRACSCALGPS